MNLNPAFLVLKHWQFALVATTLAAALGLAAFFSIPRTEDPQLDPPIFIVNAVLPGATPADVEELVTRPIEDAVYRLDGIREVRSTSTDSVSSTTVEFNWGTDPEGGYDNVTREVNALRASLPEGLQRLEILRARPINVSIVQVGLASDVLPMRRLEKLADNLRERLGRIPGINQAEYWGAGQTDMRVELDLARLAALRLPASAVAASLRAAGLETPIGAVHAGDRRFTVKYGGAFRSPEEIAAVPITAREGRVLRIGDVARIGWAQEDPDHITRFNGRRALLVTATQAKNQDVTRLSRAISAELDAFERTLPGGVTLLRGFDQSENVRHRLGGLGRDFLIALVLVSLTLLPLGLRAATVVMVSIPLSLLIGVGILFGLGFTLNQLAISGFVLALGLLVDDAIVVVENIERWLRQGADRTAAVVAGTGQIAAAVVGCTACLIFSFLPLLALPEASGEFIRSLPVAVISTVIGSVVVALAITPLAARLLLAPHADPRGSRLLQFVQNGINRFYAPLLRRALDQPKRWLAGLLAACALAVPLLQVIGTSLFPPAETPQFLVRVEMPQGAAQRRTDEAVRWVEKVISQRPEVRWTSSNVGRGNPQIYYNVGQKETDPAFGEVAVGLKEWQPGKSEALLSELRRTFSTYAGARISVITFVNGPQIEAPIVVRIAGPNVGRLTELSRRVEAVMAGVPGVRDIGNPLRQPRTDLHLAVDEASAAALGVAPGAIREALEIGLTGTTVAAYRDADGDDYDVKVQLANSGRADLEQLGRIFVPTQGGSSAPLNALASPRFTSEPARIDRIDRTRMVAVTAYVQPGVLVSKASADVLEAIRTSVDLPQGYTIGLGGEAETSSRSFSGLVPAILISSLGILAVLVLEFGRFRTVAVVAGIVPFGFLGAVIALWVTGHSLSFTAAIGLIALVGIEIKNSILLVDFTNQLEKQGVSTREALERAGEIRFLPVLLTSVTAIGGLLPLALENSGLFSPLAIAMIGGLIPSTLLARIATPVMYLLLSGRTSAQVTHGTEGVPA